MLQVLDVRALCGPNLWHRNPVLLVEVAAEPLRGDGLIRLLSRLEGNADTSSLTPEPHFATAADALNRIALLLQAGTDGPTGFGAVRPTAYPHIWTVAFEIEDPRIGRATLDTAMRLIESLDEPDATPIDEVLRQYSEVVNQHRSGRRTRHLIQAAIDRHIPVYRLDDESLLQLGQGIHRRRLRTAVTDRTSLLAETVSRDKQLCRQLLSTVGLPVVEGMIAVDAEAAVRFAESRCQPVVVKPRDADYGNGVSLNLRDPARIRAAWRQARAHSPDVIVERYQPGDWYRLFVVEHQVVAAAQRIRPKIVGDGKQTVAQLIQAANTDPRRGTAPQFPLEPIRVGSVELAMLYHQELGLDSIPVAGSEVLLREDAYLATGATQIDVMDFIHPQVAEVAVEAAALIGLDVAGVDVISSDLSLPLSEQSLAILEVNAEPAFTMHLSPYCVPSRPVPSAILAALFPPGETGRIPLVAVYGDPEIAASIAVAFRSAEPMTGFVTSHSWQLGNRTFQRNQSSLADNLRSIWLHPNCAACVAGISDRDIELEGLPFDRSDLMIFTDMNSNDGARQSEIIRLLLSTEPRVIISGLRSSKVLAEFKLPNCQLFILVESRDEGECAWSNHQGDIVVTRVGDQLEAQQNGIIRRIGRVSCDEELFMAAIREIATDMICPDRALVSSPVKTNDRKASLRFDLSRNQTHLNPLNRYGNHTATLE